MFHFKLVLSVLNHFISLIYWNSRELKGTQGNSRKLKGTQGNSRELKGTQRNSKELKGTHLNSFEPIELKRTQGNCDFISFVLLDTNGRWRRKKKRNL